MIILWPMTLLLAQATFTGNLACRKCHPAIYAKYQSTPMARSSGVVAGDVVAGSFQHPASGIQFSVDQQGLVAGRKLTHYVGSGAAGRSYFYGLEGFLFQAPVTWYAQKGRWDMSPGYEQDRDPAWNRAVTPNCLFCHASQVRSIYGTENGYADPPFQQDGVGCERCHGAGSEHVQGKAKMVNPAKLDPMRRDSVCSQCHLAGEARVEKSGKPLGAYRAGDLLSDFVSYFVLAGGSGGGVKATGYVERLAESRCKQASGDKLWCATCHDPHSVPEAQQRVAYFREKCLACHQQAHRDAAERDCMSCHMPRAQAADGGHGVLTDHAILKKPAAAALHSESSWKLKAFLGEESPRETGIAYAEVGVRTGNRSQQDEAIRLLSQCKLDAEVAVRLGDLLQRQGKTREAEALYQTAIRLQPPGPLVALVNLGVIHGSRGEYEEAIRWWRAAIERSPGQREAMVNLIRVLRALGRAEEAVRVEEALRRFAAQSPAKKR